jgi:hypothetical protein
MNQILIMQLAIGYTLVGAFIFTVVVTLLSLVGWIKFADNSQQKKLFYSLIVELVIGCLTFFFNFIKLNTVAVSSQVENNSLARPVEEKVDTTVTSVSELPEATQHTAFTQALDTAPAAKATYEARRKAGDSPVKAFNLARATLATTQPLDKAHLLLITSQLARTLQTAEK